MNGFENDKIAFAEFEVDTAHRRLFREGEPVALYAKAFDLLEFLLARNGQIVSKDEILDHVWPGQFVEESNLSVQVSALRKALGDKRDSPRFLVTVPGKGYKFAANITIPNSGLIIEKSKVARVVVHEEIEHDDFSSESSDIVASPRTSSRSLLTSSTFNRTAIGVLAVLTLLGSTFLVYRFGGFAGARVPFADTKLTRVTNSGRVSKAALSPDGKYIAYVSTDADGNSLWLRQAGTATDIRLLPASAAQFWGLKFSPDGGHIYYVVFWSDKADTEIFRIPSLGGVAEKISDVITSTVEFSPDGKRIAFVQPDSAGGFNYLITADTDGANPQVLAKLAHPDTFLFPGDYIAWSQDGASIAAVVSRTGESESFSSIMIYVALNGTELQLGEQRLHDIGALEWLADGGGVILSARDAKSKSAGIFHLSFPGGEVRQIVDDLNGYTSLTGSADGRSFTALQTKTVESIWVGDVDSGPDAYKEIVAEADDLKPLVWMPDGRIVFRSDSGGEANLWVMDSDGSNRKQLTTKAGVENRGLCVSSDGKYIVFVSTRSGRSNLWRVDADGRNPLQLMTGDAEVYPRCSPDSSSVIYQKGIYTRPTLWRVPLAGGDAVQLTDFHAKWPSISNDGRRVAFMQLTRDKWLIGIASIDGRAVISRLEAPGNKRESSMYWSADDRSLLYIGSTGSDGNIWQLPLDGSPARQLTNFSSHTLADFTLSRDGKRLAVTRTSSVSDVVLIESAPE